MVRGSIIALIALLLSHHPATAQIPRAAPPPGRQEPPTTPLDDVVVEGDRLESLAQEFVDSLAAPARGRGLARWEGEVCLGVVNFRPQAAHQLVDHISDVARDLEIDLGEPGCDPNIVIVGTSDGRALASALVGRQRSAFRLGYSRSNRGAQALQTFRTSDAPVRWWHISLLFNTIDGEVAMRLPGRGPAALPNTGRCLQRLGGVNRCNEVTDRIVRAVIIVDVNALPAAVSFNQLADYLSIVALAQVEPDTDFSTFDTVLNVLKNPQGVSGLTEWDMNYLRALYAGEPQRLDAGEQAEALAERMRHPTPH